MIVVAKFKVESNRTVDDGQHVLMHPVTGGSPENDSFFVATPSGSISLRITTDAAKAFVPGKEYRVTFEAAPDPEAEAAETAGTEGGTTDAGTETETTETSDAGTEAETEAEKPGDETAETETEKPGDKTAAPATEESEKTD